MKVLIIYTSQNGSTLKVAQTLKKGFEHYAYETDLYRIKEVEDRNIADYSIIGIGYPTYFYRPSYEVINFINNHSFDGKKVFTFVTFGTDIGDGANQIRKMLKHKKAIEIGYFSCHGRDLFPGYTKNGYVFSPDGPTQDELTKASEFVKRMSDCIESGVIDEQSLDPKPNLLYRFESFLTGKRLIEHIYCRFFSIDTARCIACDRCIHSCPMENISKKHDKDKVWGRKCILCTQCEIICPKNAITSPTSWLVFKPLMRLNIRIALKKGIPFEVIPLDKGEQN